MIPETYSFTPVCETFAKNDGVQLSEEITF